MTAQTSSARQRTRFAQRPSFTPPPVSNRRNRRSPLYPMEIQVTLPVGHAHRRRFRYPIHATIRRLLDMKKARSNHNHAAGDAHVQLMAMVVRGVE